MARARWLKPEFFTDNKACEASDSALLVFSALWVEADDGGVCPGDARIIFGRRFIKRERHGWTDLRVEQALVELEILTLVVRFTYRGEVYLLIPEFTKKQGIKPKQWRHLGLAHDTVVAAVLAKRPVPQEAPAPGAIEVSHPDRSQRSLFYVLHAVIPGGELVKFGTTDDFEYRLMHLRSTIPVPLEPLACVPFTVMTEAAAKELWAPLLAKGNEWFHATPEVIAWARSLPTNGVSSSSIRRSNGVETALERKPIAGAVAGAVAVAVAVADKSNTGAAPPTDNNPMKILGPLIREHLYRGEPPKDYEPSRCANICKRLLGSGYSVDDLREAILIIPDIRAGKVPCDDGLRRWFLKQPILTMRALNDRWGSGLVLEQLMHLVRKGTRTPRNSTPSRIAELLPGVLP